MSTIPYNEANLHKIKEVADRLQGTCRSLDDVLQEVFDDENVDLIGVDIELLHELDDITQECQGCNWWFETSELNDEQLCGDCRE